MRTLSRSRELIPKVETHTCLGCGKTIIGGGYDPLHNGELFHGKDCYLKHSQGKRPSIRW